LVLDGALSAREATAQNHLQAIQPPKHLWLHSSHGIARRPMSVKTGRSTIRVQALADGFEAGPVSISQNTTVRQRIGIGRHDPRHAGCDAPR